MKAYLITVGCVGLAVWCGTFAGMTMFAHAHFLYAFAAANLAFTGAMLVFTIINVSKW